MDPINSHKANKDKFNYKSDPILQQNDYYVSTNKFNFIQKVQQSKVRPESKN